MDWPAYTQCQSYLRTPARTHDVSLKVSRLPPRLGEPDWKKFNKQVTTPTPVVIVSPDAHITKAIDALRKQGLIEDDKKADEPTVENETTRSVETHRPLEFIKVTT